MKMRTSWYIGISPVCVECGFLVERTVFVSDVSDCTLEGHRGAACCSLLGSLIMLNNYKEALCLYLSHWLAFS